MSQPDYARLIERALARIEQTESELARLRAARNEPIAIIALSCRVPGADSPEQLWQLLAEGRSLTREVPRERWDVERWYDQDPERRGRTYSRWGCFLSDWAGFDAELFGISRREAQALDPQQRLLLELSWEAFERAGLNPSEPGGRRAGVFVGASSFDYLRLSTAVHERIEAHTGSGAAPSALAGRLAFNFGLTGPTATVDSACSSSLVALHLAMQALRQDECELCLAAGSSLMLTPELALIEARTRMLAADGRCKSFDAAADGVVRGEGAVVVLLRRLRDALAAGDPILAVLRGSAVNQNGRGASLTAPNARAQRELITLALRDAQVAPEAVDVVEAHGTGTALGDPIEAEALADALCAQRPTSAPLWIGSLKPNLGHLEAAAGLAGLAKLVLSLERGQIAPSIHVDAPHPAIDWSKRKLALPTELTPWPERGRDRRIGAVSSFGFAGTNAHVIVEQAPPVAPAPVEEAGALGLLVLSARTPGALRTLAERWSARLQSRDDASLSALCWTAAFGRAQLGERLALVGTRAELQCALASFAAGAVPALRARSLGEPAVGWLIDAPGEGLEDDAALLHDLGLLQHRLPPGDPAQRKAQCGRLAALVALLERLRDQLAAPDELCGVAGSAPLAAWLAGALARDQALVLALAISAYHEASQAERAGLAACCARLARSASWSAPQRGLVHAQSGERAGPATRPERWFALDPPTDELRADTALAAEARRALSAAGAALVVSVGARAAGPLGVALFDRRRALALHGALWVNGARGQLERALGAGQRTVGAPRRVLAPSYPFEHEPFWLPHLALGQQPAAGAGAAHPLLGVELELAESSGPRRFEASIGADAPTWLAEHRVFGQLLVPAAAWLELGLSLGRTLCTAALAAGAPGIELRALEFLRPLSLAPGARYVLQTLAEPDGSHGFRFSIHAREQGGTQPAAWTLHARGRLAPLPPGARPEAALAPELADAAPADLQPLYARALASGVEFGPQFRALTRVARGAGCELGELALSPQLAWEAGQMAVHPVLLDACLRVIGCDPSLTHEQGAWLPARLDALRWWAPAHAPQRSVCRAQVERASDDCLHAGARCATPDGALWFELQGFELRRRRALATQPQETRASIHRLQWRRLGAQRAQLMAGAQPAVAAAAGPALLARVARYERDLAHLEELAGDCVSAALEQLGGLAPGARVTAAALCQGWGVADARHGLVARLLAIAAERGELAPLPEGGFMVRALRSVPALDARFAQAAAQLPEVAHELAALQRCGRRLAEVLRGELDPLELLLPGGDTRAVELLYRAPLIELKNRELGALCAALCAGQDGPRILEVGAGTGETSAHVLQALREAGVTPSEYRFSDVSRAFLERARERFGAQPWFRCSTLDLDQPPPRGGESLGRFDVIIASNVLHVTRTLRATLAHLRGLLAPGGQLVLMEGAARLRWVDLSFGLTAGWWRFADHDLRPEYPLLDAGRWCELLAAEGFAQVRALRSPGELAILEQQALIVARATITRDPSARWLLVGGGEFGARLTAELRAHGEAAQQLRELALEPGSAELAEPLASVPARVSLQTPGELGAWLRRLAAAGQAPTHVVHLWALEQELNAQPDCEPSCRSALAVVQACLEALPERPPALWLVSRGAQAAGQPAALPGLARAALWGLGRVLNSEHPELACRRLDLDPALALCDPRQLAAAADELRSGGREDEVALRAGARWAPRLLRGAGASAASKLPVRGDGSYLITGGLGGVGLASAEWLAARGARQLCLLGRSAPSTAALARIEALRAAGVQVRVERADVSDEAALAAVLARLRAELPPLRGVVHSAGVIADGVLRTLDWPRFAQVLAPKVQGAWHLHELTRDDPVELFVLYSSAAALLRAWGQANHSAANTFLDALAEQRRALGMPGLVIDWGAWSGVGKADRPDAERRMQELGIASMAPERALAALEQALSSGMTQAAILDIDWPRYTRQLRDMPLLDEVLSERAPDACQQPALLAALRAEPAGGRHALLRDWLSTRVAGLLGAAQGRAPDVRQPLFELGLDSLLAIELKNALSSALGRPLRATLLFDFSSIEALVVHLLGELAQELPGAPDTAPERRAPALPPARAEDALVEQIRGLDDAVLGALINAEYAAIAGGDVP